VLSREPHRADPPYGTVQVVIDGVFGAFPSLWTSRSDLTTLFPPETYPGVTNALGVSAVDTTTLANGVHTIAWVVTANNGQADGIGSRYFTVANGSGLSSSNLVASGFSRKIPAAAFRLKAEATALVGRRGWDVTAPLRTYEADADGRVTIQSEELDRIELHVGEGATGSLRVGGALGSLPIGSYLDPATGIFTWQPGVGFVHAYDFVFGRCDGSRCQRRDVRIVLNPKTSTRAGPQVVIDSPRSQEDVAQPFVVAGWAIDLDGEAGTGVDTLHVWAYPADGGDPIFVGPTAYGGARPDVAAVFGDRFTKSGYGITVESLPPGTYDLAVFAWSTVQGTFVPAKLVRVRVR